MRVLLIGPLSPPIHGCSLANDVVAKYLKDENINHEIINTSVDSIASDQIGKFELKKIRNFMSVYLKIYRVLFADIIYTTPGQTFWGILKYAPFYILSILLKKKYIIHVHGNHLGNEYSSLKGGRKKIFRYLISKASVGIVLSKSLVPNFENLLPTNRIVIIENFADNSLVNVSIEEKKTEILSLLYLSNLMEEKGILKFLDCLITLKEQGINYEANIAGKIDKKIEQQIFEKLEIISDRVKYHGIVTGLAKSDLLIKSNVFVLPTFYKMEGQPISLIEAMATGNIIVSTNFSGIPDIIDTSNGFLIDPHNQSELVSTILKINLDLSLLIEKIGLSNRVIFTTRFSEKKFCDNLIKVFNELSKVKSV